MAEVQNKFFTVPETDPELMKLLDLAVSNAATPEPAPTGEGAVVLYEVEQYLIKRGHHLLVADLRARAEMGRQKYGTLLRANNGRNVGMDLYQELLDAVMYSMQARMEDPRSKAGSYFDLLVRLAGDLAASGL